MWIGGFGGFGENSINLKYDITQWEYSTDSSFNESISCEVSNNKQLKLKMLLNTFGNRDAAKPEQIVKEIWKNYLSHRFN